MENAKRLTKIEDCYKEFFTAMQFREELHQMETNFTDKID